MVVKLYRGDSIPKSCGQTPKNRARSFAEHFISGGLYAKFLDGGSSELIGRRSLFDLVIAHIGYENNSEEQKLSSRSPLISFSKLIERAFYFSNRNEKKLEPCEFGNASHFVWCLQVDLYDEIEPGRYAFRYKADPVNCIRVIQQDVQNGYTEFLETGCIGAYALATLNGLCACRTDLDSTIHYAEIIDVVKYINSSTNKYTGNVTVLHNALEYANRDKEWLVYPKDPMPDGCGYSSIFAMNQHLEIYGCYGRCYNRESMAIPPKPKADEFVWNIFNHHVARLEQQLEKQEDSQ